MAAAALPRQPGAVFLFLGVLDFPQCISYNINNGVSPCCSLTSMHMNGQANKFVAASHAACIQMVWDKNQGLAAEYLFCNKPFFYAVFYSSSIEEMPGRRGYRFPLALNRAIMARREPAFLAGRRKMCVQWMIQKHAPLRLLLQKNKDNFLFHENESRGGSSFAKLV